MMAIHTVDVNAEMATKLEEVFPWLSSDSSDDGEQISGADTIDALQQLFYVLKANASRISSVHP